MVGMNKSGGIAPMAVNPISESAYLKGLCLCTDHRDCYHGPCQVRRQLRCGKVLLENWAGNVLLAERRQVTVKNPATAIV